MASSDSQIDKTQRWHPKRAELLDVNMNSQVHKALIYIYRENCLKISQC